jgi:hypothetical protein
MPGPNVSIGLGMLLVLLPAVTATLPAQASRVDTLLARLSTMPTGTQNSRIRADPVAGTDLIRVWVDANEDDTRLYTPAGAQMDADFQVSCLVGRGRLPDSVSLLFETRGDLEPGGPGPHTLVIRADTRVLTVAQHENAPARSGPLLFLSLQANVPFEEFLALATAGAVEGRIWDVPFRMLDSQLDLLRAWAVRVVGISTGT